MTSALFDPLSGMTAVGAATDDRAWLVALCEVETALARACARADLLDLPTALEIGAAAEALASADPAELGRQAIATGDPVIPLVEALRQAVERRAGRDAAQAVHRGATSQDVLDSAGMLVSSRALGVIAADVDECANRIAALARAHRDTVMCGRTLLQPAAATTFGALAATWGSALDRCSARLRAVRDLLPAQLGGPAGTLAGWHPKGFVVLAAFADELDLREPTGVWHTDRGVITELAGALGATAAAVAKPATDVVLLTQPEIGELREGRHGGSSSVPRTGHPVAAIAARGVAAQAPGLVATLLASGTAELQGSAGLGNAEWAAFNDLLRCVGGAASRLRTCLSDLEVDAGRMRAGVDERQPDTGHAADLVDRYLDARRA